MVRSNFLSIIYIYENNGQNTLVHRGFLIYFAEEIYMSRRDFISSDYNIFDRGAKEFFVKWISEKLNAVDISTEEKYCHPDVTCTVGKRDMKFELECRRGYNEYVWNSDIITVPIKFSYTNNYDEFYHIVLDCEEIIARKITKFIRIPVKYIVTSVVLPKSVFNKKTRLYDKENFYNVHRDKCLFYVLDEPFEF
jgi:hypothetical protein